MKKILFHAITHPSALIVWSVIVVALTIVTGWAHAEAIIDHFRFGEDVELEEDIAIILVAYGTLLQGREMFLNHLPDHAGGPDEDRLNGMCQQYGTYLLMVGLVMELNDQCFEPVIDKLGLGLAGVGLMVALDLIAIGVSLILGWTMQKGKPA